MLRDIPFLSCATEDRDFERTRGSIRFVPRGAKEMSIMIPITDDQQTEISEPLTVSFSTEDPGMQIMIPSPMVIIIDNDISE